MLKVLRKADRTAPIFCCDICDSWIDDIGHAAAVFAAMTEEGETAAVLITHKGACHDKAEAGLRAEGKISGWQELGRYLTDGLHNGGLSLERLNEAQRREDEIGGRL